MPTPILARFFSTLLFVAIGSGALVLVDAHREPGPPRVEDMPAYRPEPIEGLISCFFPIGVATEDLVEGVDVKRSIRIDRHSGEVIVIHDEWLPGPGWQQLAWQPLWGASMPVCMSSRSIDELFVLVDPDRKDDALSIGPAGGLLQLERWTLIGGPGWPAMVEDASVVAPLGARSGRARWSTTYEGGVRLGRAKRDLFTLVREPLAELDVDPRALEVDPDGRFVLIASHDQGILQVDLTTPGAPAVVAVRPPSPSFSYTLPSGDGYGGGAMDPVLGDSVHGERVLILDDGRGGYWILLDRDNDGAFDVDRHLGELQTAELGFSPSTYLVDPRAQLRWSP